MNTEFYRPSCKEDAIKLLSKYGKDLMIVNGGTDAVLSIVEGKADPKAIMHVAGLPGFHEIMEDGDYLYIGGGATFAEMQASPAIARYKGLIEALSHLASPAIRTIGTAAGNICTAAPAADCAAMLYALRAEAVLESSEGTRILPLSDFYITTSSYSTVIKENELVTEIRIPLLRKGEGSGYCRLSRRKAQDIAKVIIGVRLALENEAIAACSVALGALNATLVHGETIEKAVIGMKKEEALEYVRSTFPPEAKLHRSYFTEYKKDVVAAAVERAFSMALGNAEGEF